MIAVFPNPANNMTTITVRNYMPDSKITVYNTNGTVMTSLPVSGTGIQLDISLYPAGLYIVKYADVDGSYYQKLLKH
jgi:hypothetical protein